MDKTSDYVHLHVHSQYSLLDGACKPDGLVEAAKRHHMPALAITDHGNLFGLIGAGFRRDTLRVSAARPRARMR